jgi:HAE1 family hydrophobic/amphiphilic exporter-1
MFLSDLSIRRPIFTVMVISALVVMGLISMFSKLGLDLFPDVAFPVVIVSTVYPGAAPQEIETLVTKPIEEAVSGVSGVKRVQSWSRESVSSVLVEFHLETDIKLAAVDVREKIAGIRDTLPDDAEEPVIQRFDPADTPVLVFTVAANRNPYEIRRTTEDVVKPLIEAAEGVGSVEIIGGLEREIQVNLDLQALQSRKIPIERVLSLTASENLNVPAGHVATGEREVTLRTLGEFRSIDEIRDVVVTDQGGSQVRIRDIGTVVDGFKEVRKTARTDGKPAVAIEIRKQSGTNTVEVADHVFEAVAQLRKTLPPDYTLTSIIDSAVRVQREVHEVGLSIFYGALMAVAVIFIFMLDWRSTFISALALPTSVITTFFFMWLMGFSINIMTLMALSLSIGCSSTTLVVADIFRRMEAGDPSRPPGRDGRDRAGGDGHDLHDRGGVPPGRFHVGHRGQVLPGVRSHRGGGRARLALRGLHARSDALRELHETGGPGSSPPGREPSPPRLLRPLLRRGARALPHGAPVVAGSPQDGGATASPSSPGDVLADSWGRSSAGRIARIRSRWRCRSGRVSRRWTR